MVDSVTIVGGLDCAWLAAFADWVLSLDVGVLDSTGKLLYRSLKGTHGTPQVFFKVLDEPSSNIKADLAISKRYLIRSGETLFCPIDEENKRRILRFSASWETILQDSFPEIVNLLAHEATSQALAKYLYCTSNIRMPDGRWQKCSSSFEDRYIFQVNPVDPLIWMREESRGHQFLQLAVKRLPELQTCLQADFSTMAISEMETINQAAKEQIESACLCYKHLPEPKPRALITKHCLSLIAQTILLYLWIMVASEIDDDICPSINGLKSLYDRQAEGLEKKRGLVLHRTMMTSGEDRGLALVFQVFAGSRFIDNRSSMPEPDQEHERMALAGNGICVYRKILEDPSLSPSSIFTFRIVRGCISYGGTHFRAVDSLYQEYTNSEKEPSILEATIRPTVTAVVEEVHDAENVDKIGMGYQVVHSTGNLRNYITWLTPSHLLDSMRNVSGLWTCFGDCQPLDKLDKLPNAGYFWRSSPDWTITISQDSIESVRDMINQIQRPAEKWVLRTLEENSAIDRSTTVVNESRMESRIKTRRMIVDEPFLSYLYLSSVHHRDLALFPFVQCLSCLIEAGILTSTPMFYVDPNSIVSLVKLKTPNQKEISFEVTMTHCAPEEL